MLWGGAIIVIALLSKLVLNRTYSYKQNLGMVFVIAGLFIVGLSSIEEKDT